jgi:hypothetical protein
MNQVPPSRFKNMTLAVIAGQAGCLTLVVIFVALFAGIWLDAQLHVRGVFTVGLLLLSIPISLFFMVRIALGAVKNLQPPPPKQQQRNSNQHPTYTEEEDL